METETIIPKTSTVFTALLRADLKTQWRNRRAVILTLLVPIIILFSWKDIIDKIGGAFALASCITIGLMATGLMGYSNSIARDRDKEIFQRLRVAPVPSWAIMISRIMVQLVMILLVTTGVFIAGFYFDKISVPASGYALAFLAAFIGGAVYLGVGQVIVGLIKNPETVNSTTRLVYFAFVMIGMLGQFGILGDEMQKIVVWSPYGTVQTILSKSLQPSSWTSTTTEALLVTIGYAVVLSTIGIKKFKWSNK
jgi:ABC-2 type transport system permease protein